MYLCQDNTFVAKRARQYRKGTSGCYEGNQGILEEGDRCQEKQMCINCLEKSLCYYMGEVAIYSLPTGVHEITNLLLKDPMSIGVTGAFPSPTRSLQFMVDLPGLGPSGWYARSIGALLPSHRARCFRAEGHRTPFGVPEVAPGVSSLLDP